MIESRLAESPLIVPVVPDVLFVPDVLLPIVPVESDELPIVDELSVTVVDDSFVSVFVLVQAVAKAIIESRKKADFTMSIMR